MDTLLDYIQWMGDFPIEATGFREMDAVVLCVIGYYDLWIMFENADIASIAVDVPYRHKGYGEQLMNHLELQALKAGCENIGLEVRVSNQDAIRLYERHDFFIIATRKDYYKDEDGYRMMKGI